MTQKPTLKPKGRSFLWKIAQKTSSLLLRFMGWKVSGMVPQIPKYVMIGYPHTSNWDTFIGLLVFTSLGVKLHWLGKHALFKGPLGWIFKLTGGVPIVREKSQNFTKEIQKIFQQFDYFVLTLSPEGTRKKTEYWRTGFYYIALNAGVPIALAFLDYPTKTGGFGPLLYPSGDLEKDLETIRAFYKNIRGKYPQNMGEIRAKPRVNDQK